MNILHVIETYLPVIAGYTIRTKYIIENQKRIGLNPIVLISALGPKSGISEEVDGIKYIWASKNISYSNNRMKKPLQWLYVDEILKRDLYMACEKYRPDIIHAHSFPPLRKSVSKICQKLNVPYVFEMRSILEEGGIGSGNFGRSSLKYKLIRYYADYNLNYSDFVVTISETLKSEIIKRGISESRVTVVPNAVDSDFFLPHCLKDSQIVNAYSLKNSFIWGYIGTFSKYEGLEHLIQAMPKILFEVENAKLVFIGSGSSLPDLKRLSLDLGVEDSVIFMGKIPFEEIRRCYSIFDLMAIPRKDTVLCNIVSPLKPLEIMSQEIPIMASNLEVIKEIIRDGGTGILVEPENSEEIARNVIMLARDKNYAKSLGKNARKWVIENRNWNIVINRYRSVYENLLLKQ